jgi:cobyrinic acid a,c-diamide synthase
MTSSRLMIAGLGGDTGKTSVSVGLCRLWKKRDYRVIPFKKGPDYIDMGWLGRAARHPCYNVDLFLMNRDQVLSSFHLNTRSADIAVIEGNRGLYDGLDAEGSVSTAEIAKLLNRSSWLSIAEKLPVRCGPGARVRRLTCCADESGNPTIWPAFATKRLSEEA